MLALDYTLVFTVLREWGCVVNCVIWQQHWWWLARCLISAQLVYTCLRGVLGSFLLVANIQIRSQSENIHSRSGTVQSDHNLIWVHTWLLNAILLENGQYLDTRYPVNRGITYSIQILLSKNFLKLKLQKGSLAAAQKAASAWRCLYVWMLLIVFLMSVCSRGHLIKMQINLWSPIKVGWAVSKDIMW